MSAACDTRKRREIVFHALPPGQAGQALTLLSALPGVNLLQVDPRTLRIEYEVGEHVLEDIEALLVAQGFHLEGSLIIRVRRALAYHCERVQRQNMGKPAPRTKNYQAFVEAWQHQPHGDHDATPQEWRQYR